MTYMEDICLALIRVFDRAVFYRDERLAGYAANSRFWANETRHALDCLAGYESRFTAFNAARIAQAQSAQEELDPKWLEPSLQSADLKKLQDRLVAVATHFFRLCQSNLERSDVIEIEQLLGIRIEEHPPDRKRGSTNAMTTHLQRLTLCQPPFHKRPSTHAWVGHSATHGCARRIKARPTIHVDRTFRDRRSRFCGYNSSILGNNHGLRYSARVRYWLASASPVKV